MILTTHALVGAVIGKNIANPWWIILVSLIIHFFLDTFRHGEYFDDRTAKVRDTWWKVGLDLLVGFSIIGFFIFSNNFSGIKIENILLGVFVSIFPDSLSLFYWTFHWKWLGKIKRFHGWAHRYSKFPKYSPERQWTLRNATNDIIISVIAILAFILF
jgi:hypothetical protein